MRILTYLLFTVFFFNFASAQTLQQYADSLRLAAQIPELGYAVIKISSIPVMEVTGYKRANPQDNTTKANLNDYFHLGSNTKAITSLLAASLVERRKIQWNTKFFDLFPNWKSLSDTGYYNITLEQLLSHRAGIEPYTSGLEFQELPTFKGNKVEQRKAFALYLIKEKPVPTSKQTYNYSNAGYTLAALMLEKVTGKSWEELINELMHDQLHLRYLFGWPNRWDIHQPWGHWIESDTLRALSPTTDYDLKLIEPAGDISMPLPDYARLVQLHLQGLAGINNILDTATYQRLHYGFKNYALGWGNTIKNGDESSSHAGSAGTFYCFTIINKTRQIAYVVIANSATEKCQHALHQLVQKMSEIYEGRKTSL